MQTVTISGFISQGNTVEPPLVVWRRGGLMVSALVSGSSGPGSSSGRGHCVVYLGKTLYSHSACLPSGVETGTGELNAGGNPAMD